MKLYPALKNYMVARRFEKAQKSASGLIALPEEWTSGDKEGTTEYRLCEIISVDSSMEKFKPGDIVLIHELDKIPPGKEHLTPEDKSLEIIPAEKVLGVGTGAYDLKPVDNVVFIELDLPKEYVSQGGIILPEICEPLEQQGNVIQAGPDCRELKVGDRVLIIRGWGMRYNFDGKKCVAMKEDNEGMLLVIEKRIKIGDIPVEVDDSIEPGTVVFENKPRSKLKRSK